MSRSLLAAPALLLFWQVAPVQVTPDSSGRIRVSLGYGAGSYRSRADVVSCDGQTIQTSSKGGQWTAATGQIDAWVTSRVRATAAVAANSATPEVPARWLAGSLVAFEGADIGIGGGVGRVNGPEAVTVPLVYVRFGALEGRHYQFDMVFPDPPVRSDPWYRFSVAHNQGRRGGPRWITGVAARGFSRGEGVLWTGDLSLPVGRDVEFTLAGRMGSGTLFHEDIGAVGRYAAWRLVAGMRVSLVR